MKAPVWLDERDAVAIHGRLLTLHGGAVGLRDRARLQAALARPRHSFAYSERPNLFMAAALYTSGLVRNHPFMDGNKRTGFVLGVLFLELNNYRFHAGEAEAAQAVWEMAAGTVDEGSYAAFLRGHATRLRGHATRKKR